MSLKNLISDYAQYNAWANERLVNWLQSKPSDLYYQSVPSSYPSLILTLNHIFAVQEFWQSIIEEIPQFSQRFMEKEPKHENIFLPLIHQSRGMAKNIEDMSETDLLKEIYLDTPWVKGTKPRYQFIQHLMNHGTYHRGQITAIGRNLGFEDAPMTDYNYYQMAL
ncbi:MAG: DinB family protein [Saprospiraceae bacterium]